MRAVPDERVHPAGGFRMGSGPTSMARDHWIVGVSGVLDGNWPSGADIRNDVRRAASRGRRSESARDAQTVPDPAIAARAARRRCARRRCLVKLFVFYSIVAIGYLALTVKDRHLSEVVFPFVALLLLMPALYTEFLRVKGRE